MLDDLNNWFNFFLLNSSWLHLVADLQYSLLLHEHVATEDYNLHCDADFASILHTDHVFSDRIEKHPY